nr:MAG TPA: hypothetical protein [Caudoviricetes sp.]
MVIRLSPGRQGDAGVATLQQQYIGPGTYWAFSHNIF